MPQEILMVEVGQPPVEDTVEDFWEDIKKKIGNHYYTTVPIGPNICLVAAENWQVVLSDPSIPSPTQRTSEMPAAGTGARRTVRGICSTPRSTLSSSSRMSSSTTGRTRHATSRRATGVADAHTGGEATSVGRYADTPVPPRSSSSSSRSSSTHTVSRATLRTRSTRSDL